MRYLSCRQENNANLVVSLYPGAGRLVLAPLSLWSVFQQPLGVSSEALQGHPNNTPDLKAVLHLQLILLSNLTEVLQVFLMHLWRLWLRAAVFFTPLHIQKVEAKT